MIRKLGLFAVALAIVAVGTVAAAQNSPGGSFLPWFNYVIGGQWTWRGQASPFIFKGATDGQYKTTFTVTTPTANRTWTLPDATSSFVGTTATQTLTNKTLTSPTITGATLTTSTLTSPTITAPTVSSFVNTGTVTFPTATGAIPVLFDCGSTGTGSQTCAPAAASGGLKVYSGRSTLASNAATITFPTAFTSSSTYNCVANDVTTRANPVQMVPASGATATITNTTGASDVVQWICAGS